MCDCLPDCSEEPEGRNLENVLDLVNRCFVARWYVGKGVCGRFNSGLVVMVLARSKALQCTEDTLCVYILVNMVRSPLKSVDFCITSSPLKWDRKDLDKQSPLFAQSGNGLWPCSVLLNGWRMAVLPQLLCCCQAAITVHRQGERGVRNNASIDRTMANFIPLSSKLISGTAAPTTLLNMQCVCVCV